MKVKAAKNGEYERTLGVWLEAGPLLGTTSVHPWRLGIALWLWTIVLTWNES